MWYQIARKTLNHGFGKPKASRRNSRIKSWISVVRFLVPLSTCWGVLGQHTLYSVCTVLQLSNNNFPKGIWSLSLLNVTLWVFCHLCSVVRKLMLTAGCQSQNEGKMSLTKSHSLNLSPVFGGFLLLLSSIMTRVLTTTPLAFSTTTRTTGKMGWEFSSGAYQRSANTP